MSKAYLCDNCGEFFAGDPKVTDANGRDICPKCVRVIEILGTIDPFEFNCSVRDEGKQYLKGSSKYTEGQK